MELLLCVRMGERSIVCGARAERRRERRAAEAGGCAIRPAAAAREIFGLGGSNRKTTKHSKIQNTGRFYHFEFCNIVLSLLESLENTSDHQIKVKVRVKMSSSGWLRARD